MSPDHRRQLRLQELTKMALNGKSLEQITHRAYQMASKKSADLYVDEVIRRVQIGAN